jgi:Surface antigen variable number repeat
VTRSSSSALSLATLFWLVAPAAIHAQDPPSTVVQPAPIVREIRITGAKELSEEVVRRAAGVVVGEPLAETQTGAVDRITESVQRKYRDEGYSFATAQVSFDPATGVMTFDVNEGTIDDVEFQGVDEKLSRRFASEFALRAGDVFNRERAVHALEALLQQTRGAIRPGRLYGDGSTLTPARDMRRRRGSFDLVERDGRRVLLVGLHEPPGRFKMVPDLGEREDWFSAVDGFVPSLGFGAAVFDHDRFNHTYVAGHLSYKVASEHGGYALGFERPFFTAPRLFLGSEFYNLTATDDRWQISSTEASLAAIGPRHSYRNYYRRYGVQIGGALRVHPQVEFLFAWRGERQESLVDRSDFSFWNHDDSFRPNQVATDGRMNAVIVGASIDGQGFDQESLEATYRRHQLETPFGERLSDSDHGRDRSPLWSINWTSEISTPTLNSDFDFKRHIISGRAWFALSPHQNFGVRAIGGWSNGVLPPQRQFAIGGIGSVLGYDFQQEVGDSMALVNLQYALGWRNGLKLFGFYDVGRTSPLPPATSAPWLNGVGWGIGVGDVRVEFGYKVNDIPGSLQVLVRLGRGF